MRQQRLQHVGAWLWAATCFFSLYRTTNASLLGQVENIGDHRHPQLLRRQDSSVVSTDGSCGLIDGVHTTCLGSFEGDCCSRLNFCGRNSSYCGDGCQNDFGVCGDSNISSDGSCGGTRGLTCRGSAEGNCCSARGFCGQTTDYCGDGCQAEFGDCHTTNSTSSRGSSSTRGTQKPTESEDSGQPSPTQETQEGDIEDEGGSDDNKALKIGLGVGIPVGVLAVGGLAAFLFLRKRRQRGVQGDSEAKDAETKPVSPSNELDAPQKPVELVGNTQAAVELPADHHPR